MRLRYVQWFQPKWETILAHRPHPLGVELLLQGKGFQGEGFSLGVYSRAALLGVIDSFGNQEPTKRDFFSRKIYEAAYTFTKPVKFAPRQGHKTRLAIHVSAWTDYGLYSPLYDPRTVTLHEQGERAHHRFIGRFRLESVRAFIYEAAGLVSVKAA